MWCLIQPDRLACCRRISLLIHPDKCKHPNAADAFEVIGDAQAEILDEQRREAVMRVLEYARGAVRETRRKATKHDSALRLAGSIHKDGREGVEREWEETEDFHEKWRVKAQDVLARAAFRRLKLAKRFASLPLLRAADARLPGKSSCPGRQRRCPHARA